MYTGPKLTKSNLVFGIDTGYGVANNDTETRFNKGEPTDNKLRLFTGANKSLSYGSNIYLVTAQETNVSDVTAPNGQYSRFTGNSSSGNEQVFWSYAGIGSNYTGSTVTFSTYLKGSGTCHLTTYDDQSGYGTSSIITLTNKWVRYSYVRAINSNATNHWSGVRGILGSTNVYIAASQTEIKGHATPFTPTTRSDTASLIDLTKATDLTLSAMSYDSTGQPDYDGTDDYINLGDYAPIRLGTNFTIECVVRPEEDKWMYHFWKGYGSNNSLALGRHSSNDKWMLASMIGGSYVYLYTGTATLNEYCHLVYTYDGSNVRVYQNGVLQATSAQTHDMLTSSSSAGIGGPNRYWNGKIPVTKIYSKVLTTEEVVSNFNAYKNRFNI